jgi:hypothetical protein
MIALRAPGHKEITMADQSWTWPADRVLVLYEWSWFNPDIDDVVGGWSRQSEADDAGYVHFEAEALRDAETVQIHPASRDFVFAKSHTFSALVRLPLELRTDDGVPLPWVRALLGG